MLNFGDGLRNVRPTEGLLYLFVLERARVPVYNLASRLDAMNIITSTTTRIDRHRIASLYLLSLT
ncbi:MAG: hypothetical protein JNM09_03670 [Blastocatellia bacterium]|nr:hypothetical protein [Blastocatellia bacterium]